MQPQPVETADPLEKVYNVPGHLHPGQEEILYDLVKSLPANGMVLEIGAYKGRSTCALATACIGTQRHIFTIDTFRGLNDDTDSMGKTTFLAEFMKHLDLCDVEEYVTPLIGFSNEYYDSWDKPLDMLFIDGGHAFDVAMGDFVAFFPHLKPGGVIAMHDVWALNPDEELDPAELSRPTGVWLAKKDLIGDATRFHNLAYGVKR